ncbi:MAG: hypothetical protein AB8A44_05385 [Prochlorococcus sp.]|jgi:putative Mn2+ efflux pump MntP
MDLIALDRRAALAIQHRFRLSNYQMLCFGWFIGLVMGFFIAVILHWAGSPHG